MSDGQSIWNTRITAFRGQLSNVTPVFDNGMIFLDNASSPGPGGESNAQPTLIYALRASDGKILWHVTDPPGVLAIQGGVLYLAQANGQVDAWRESDDQHLWHYQAPTSMGLLGIFSPPENPAILFLVGGQRGPGRLEVLRASDGKFLWSYPAK
jgi:outer membrane protein assembly factor BamB